MSRRFFSTSPTKDQTVVIADQEAHHLLHVMRAKVGDQITTFDGTGCEYEAEITRMDRRSATCAVLSTSNISRELAVQLTLGIALPKGDRQRWLIEKCVELGVTRIVPLTTKYGVAQPVSKALDRLRRTVIEASKQCERNLLMEIAEPESFDHFINSSVPDELRWFADPRAESTDWKNALAEATSIRVAIGPEGGFSEAELEQATSSDWQPISLGRRILRIETAALSIAATVGMLSEA
ncbi:MAG: 16S rRNA (uracil(1498)-N(3))-methyltransferase [Blastopirellula sp.]|nr:MAG: 16S rRNA (uracil(1498)-N(3))-methyltransferase [Blastopirellula sp.]